MSAQSHLLRLPSELRIKIYELILAFNRPIKLRQTIAGSQNTNVLRTNRQVYEESLPLRSVVVEYQTHIGNFTRFKSFINQETHGELKCTALGTYVLRNRLREDVEVTFHHAPLSRIWPRAVALADSARDERQEVETLTELREIDHDIPDKIWLLLCTKKYGAADQYWGAVSKAWQKLDAQEASDVDEYCQNLDGLTEAVQSYLAIQTVHQARRLLIALKGDWNNHTTV
ncbi:hypothetical protein BTJ68_03567 [Hortaea werneckii EXF-2000]|uniref:F-box domain-containing protein n=1 Tax=Hortaea werneckii EXF-2000 TaxID=1157616 RepID=A0A1Z5TJ86_HORWE|nr:hypothetical protein BTJ68_03567 [Hortaea werneckii EXF-2000]